jgi:hypothetical protein
MDALFYTKSMLRFKLGFVTNESRKQHSFLNKDSLHEMKDCLIELN